MKSVILGKAGIISTNNLAGRKKFALDLPRSNTLFERTKKDLHITMNNGGKFVLKNYFTVHEASETLTCKPKYQKPSKLSSNEESLHNWDHLLKY